MSAGAGAVAYVTRMFPQVSETFVANEILGLERLGLPVRVYSYRRAASPVPHECVRLLRAPVTYLPDPLHRNARALLAAQRALQRLEPDRYRATLRYVLGTCAREGNPDTVRRFLQAVCLARLLRADGVGHVHAHFAHGATRIAQLASMLTGIPYSFTAHARDIFSRDVDLRLLRSKIEQARFVVTVSGFNRRFLDETLGLANGDVRVLYNGVDLDKFSPDPGVECDEALVLGVGRLVEKKGFSHLVEACRLLRAWGIPARCEIVGDGELRPRLEAEIRRAGLAGSVTLAGMRSQEELVTYYRRAALVALPAVVASDGNRDALPTVLLEAMACGCPVVATRLTGVPEIVEHGRTGLLVEPGSATQLAHAIALLLEDEELRRLYGLAGRERAERTFDARETVAELHALLSGSLGRETPRRRRETRLSHV